MYPAPLWAHVPRFFGGFLMVLFLNPTVARKPVTSEDDSCVLMRV